MDISWWQLLIASVGLSLGIGGVFIKYIQSINKADAAKAVASAINAFRDNEINPVIAKLSDDLQKVADLSNRLGQVEVGIKTLNRQSSELAVTVAANAKQARDDLSGLGTRLEGQFNTSMQNQTNLLVKIFETKR